jgi:hypothetical protein
MTQVTVVMLNTEETHGNYIFCSLLNIPAASQNVDYRMIFKIQDDKLKKDMAGSGHDKNEATIWHMPQIQNILLVFMQKTKECYGYLTLAFCLYEQTEKKCKSHPS